MDQQNPHPRGRHRHGGRHLVRLDLPGLHPHLTAAAVGLAVLLTACGDDNGGENDTLWTGLSGLVIFALIAWAAITIIRRRR